MADSLRLRTLVEGAAAAATALADGGNWVSSLRYHSRHHALQNGCTVFVARPMRMRGTPARLHGANLNFKNGEFET
jgi:hypothetical protein